jgi:Na+/H+ antiporter NhaD/arsenite permease-like protein
VHVFLLGGATSCVVVVLVLGRLDWAAVCTDHHRRDGHRLFILFVVVSVVASMVLRD